jgi:hypothetical protein
MFRLSLDPIYDNKSQNHNEFELWSPLPPFLDHLVNRTILTELLMVKIMHDNNISVSSVATPPISNGTALSILVEPVTRLHPDITMLLIFVTTLIQKSIDSQV